MKIIMMTFCKDKKCVTVEINDVKKIKKNLVVCNKFFEIGTSHVIFDLFNRTIYFDSDHICFTYLDYEKNSDKIDFYIKKVKKSIEKIYVKLGSISEVIKEL